MVQSRPQHSDSASPSLCPRLFCGSTTFHRSPMLSGLPARRRGPDGGRLRAPRASTTRPAPPPPCRKWWPFFRPPFRSAGWRVGASCLTTFHAECRPAAAAAAAEAAGGWRPRPPAERGGAGGGPGPRASRSPGPRWSWCSPRWCCGRPRQVRRRRAAPDRGSRRFLCVTCVR